MQTTWLRERYEKGLDQMSRPPPPVSAAWTLGTDDESSFDAGRGPPLSKRQFMPLEEAVVEHIERRPVVQSRHGKDVTGAPLTSLHPGVAPTDIDVSGRVCEHAQASVLARLHEHDARDRYALPHSQEFAATRVSDASESMLSATSTQDTADSERRRITGEVDLRDTKGPEDASRADPDDPKRARSLSRDKESAHEVSRPDNEHRDNSVEPSTDQFGPTVLPNRNPTAVRRRYSHNELYALRPRAVISSVSTMEAQLRSRKGSGHPSVLRRPRGHMALADNAEDDAARTKHTAQVKNERLLKQSDPRVRYSRAELLALRAQRWSGACPPSLVGLSIRKPIHHDNTPRALEVDTKSQHVRSADTSLSGADSQLKFEDLDLRPEVLDGLCRCGFHAPSPVQARGIPAGRLGVDLVAQAKSGTGKTVVFGVLALEALGDAVDGTSGGPRVLILAPTRDIAGQIRDVIADLSRAFSPPPTLGLFIGGLPVKNDEHLLAHEDVSIAVGSPGRIEDLIRRGRMNVSGIQLLVLDEADRLLDESFGASVTSICQILPSRKQVCTFSATYPPELMEGLRGLVRSPYYVDLYDGTSGQGAAETDSDSGRANESTVAPAVLEAVTQAFAKVEDMGLEVQPDDPLGSQAQNLQVAALTRLLSRQAFNQAIVFANNATVGAAAVAAVKEDGFAVVYMSGSIEQRHRIKAMDAMRRSNARVLVCTDLVARGMDFPNCDLVVHLDMPRIISTYLHRVGRAGRYGAVGLSVIIGDPASLAHHTARIRHELGLTLSDASRLVQSDRRARTAVERPMDTTIHTTHGATNRKDPQPPDPRGSHAFVTTEQDDARTMSNDSREHKPMAADTKQASRQRLAHPFENSVPEFETDKTREAIFEGDGDSEEDAAYSVSQVSSHGSLRSSPDVIEAWAQLARAQYDNGYRSAYEQAWRMASRIYERLGDAAVATTAHGVAEDCSSAS